MMNSSPHYSLRSIGADDFYALRDCVGHPAFPQDLPLAAFYARGELPDWYSRQLAKIDAGTAHIFAIDTLTGDRSIGQITVTQLPEKTLWVLSYWLQAPHWGKGYISHALDEVLSHIYSKTEIDEIRAGVATHNSSSMKVMMRLGMQRLEKSDYLLRSPYPATVEVSEFRTDRLLWANRPRKE